MAELRVRFTIREMMFVVAISALSLGGRFPVALLVIQVRDMDAIRAMLGECLRTVKQRPAGFAAPVAIPGQ